MNFQELEDQVRGILRGRAAWQTKTQDKNEMSHFRELEGRCGEECGELERPQ